MTYTPLSQYRKDIAALIIKTRLLLGDPAGERWSTARILEALNFACVEFAIETECVKDEVEIQLTENGWSYNVKEAVEADATLKPYGWLKRVGYSGTASPALLPTSRFVTDHMGSDITSTGSTNQFHLNLLTYGEIGVLPIPNADGSALPADSGNIQVSYVGMPDEATATTDYPDSSIQAMYHQYLPYGAAYMLLENGDEEDVAMAAGYEANFRAGCYENVGDQYAGQTGYADMRPM